MTDHNMRGVKPRPQWQVVEYCPSFTGNNENTNRFLRQYFPKGIDISGFRQVELSATVRQLNERPRKALQYQTAISAHPDVAFMRAVPEGDARLGEQIR